jgi:hypothetical protein
MNNALRHINKCNLCKQEIKKNSHKKNIIDNDEIIYSTGSLSQVPFKGIQRTSEVLQKSDELEKFSVDNKNIERQLQMITEKLGLIDNVNKKHNMYEDVSQLQYQNMLLQKALTKYIEDSDEKKIINNKIDKLYDLLNNNFDKKRELFAVSEYGQSRYSTIELNYFNIGIFILIVLFIIDIIIRVQKFER